MNSLMAAEVSRGPCGFSVADCELRHEKAVIGWWVPGALDGTTVTWPPHTLAAQAPSLTQGGAAWFLDLTQSDPMYGLPLLCTLTTLGMIQYGMNVTGEQMASPERAGACLQGCVWCWARTAGAGALLAPE